jgi:hypothetical protein
MLPYIQKPFRGCEGGKSRPNTVFHKFGELRGGWSGAISSLWQTGTALFHVTIDWSVALEISDEMQDVEERRR